MSEQIENHPSGTCGNQEFYQKDFDHEGLGRVIALFLDVMSEEGKVFCEYLVICLESWPCSPNDSSVDLPLPTQALILSELTIS